MYAHIVCAHIDPLFKRELARGVSYLDLLFDNQHRIVKSDTFLRLEIRAAIAGDDVLV